MPRKKFSSKGRGVGVPRKVQAPGFQLFAKVHLCEELIYTMHNDIMAMLYRLHSVP